MNISMPSEAPHIPRKPLRDAQNAPRVGVPWRTAKEEAENKRHRYDDYLRAIREAGGREVEISLCLPPQKLDELMETLDAVVLPGSPADVDPSRYRAMRHAQCADPDPQRERTDFALLDHAFAANKPVLAICYGTQLLNVYLGGKLIQNIASEFRTAIRHDKEGHAARIEPGSKLATLAESAGAGLSVEVNSSHHQAIAKPGPNLRVTAQAPDGVIEAVEWGGSGNWVVGVQWHPERMAGDALAAALFRELIAAAYAATVQG
jgi:putative glutamine amidotransferase